MEELRIDLQEIQTAFQPGDRVAGKVAWNLSQFPRKAELRLMWYTQGKGDTDAGIVQTQSFDGPGQRDQRNFEFTLPDGPHSFNGQLITLKWALELAIDPGSRTQRLEIVVAPDRRPIELPTIK